MSHKKIHPPAEFLTDCLGALIAPMGIVKQENIFLSFLQERQQTVFTQHDLWNISENITHVLVDPLWRVRIIRYIVLIEIVFIHSHYQHQLNASLMRLMRQQIKDVLHLRNNSLTNRQAIFNVSVIEIQLIWFTTAKEISIQVDHIDRATASKPIQDEITGPEERPFVGKGLNHVPQLRQPARRHWWNPQRPSQECCKHTV